MSKLIFFMHTSLDGFVAGLNGEMDWINIDDSMSVSYTHLTLPTKA